MISPFLLPPFSFFGLGCRSSCKPLLFFLSFSRRAFASQFFLPLIHGTEVYLLGFIVEVSGQYPSFFLFLFAISFGLCTWCDADRVVLRTGRALGGESSPVCLCALSSFFCGSAQSVARRIEVGRFFLWRV